MSDANEISRRFDPLWEDVQDSESYPAIRPLLGHYTSIGGLERIMATDELWLSNPLYMSDLEELRFGLQEGAVAFHQDPECKRACGSDARYSILRDIFDYYYGDFEQVHAFDTYVGCPDGLLSMWRGYGGNGSGAAIVFDTGQLEPVNDSPLILSRVVYASPDGRRKWIRAKLGQFTKLLEQARLKDEELQIAARTLFERFTLFALFTKHHGFREEQEWRIVYMTQRDSAKKLHPMRHYAIGPRGIEPKLRLRLQPLDGVLGTNVSMAKTVKRIILGPTVSSALAIRSVQRMLEMVGKHELIDRVSGSTTPYRPR